jgi:succinate dehydrogenase / fumarate reductase iron-sulfur subunit
MKFLLKIWRQKNQSSKGKFKEYVIKNISPDISFLEMLDILNEKLIFGNQETISFDHDCREGICGSCSMMINGFSHGPKKMTTVCQLHMRDFKSGDKIIIEPWRSKIFPVIKDLVVNRNALDKIIQSSGFITLKTGNAPDANSIPISKNTIEYAMDAASCIGCGACVASCKNSSAMLFTAAKIAHLNSLPQGKPEKYSRIFSMISKMDELGFGNCSNYEECSSTCPKGISLDCISKLNKDYLIGKIKKFLKN